MHDFQIQLRLETPLLLGGAEAGSVDDSGMLSGLAIRGLVRTFARALIGPYVDQDWSLVRNAENRLLGTAGGEGGARAAYRVHDVSPRPLADAGEFPNRPGNRPEDRKKGQRGGYPPQSNRAAQTRIIVVRPRPEAVRNDPALPEVLRAITWTAFAFGSLGGRARRGYGSLTMEGGPSYVQAAQAPRDCESYAALADLEGREDLGRKLKDGLNRARKTLTAWLRANGFPVSGHANPPAKLFQLFGSQYVFLGNPASATWSDVMCKLMDAASDAKRSDRTEYARVLGSEKPRLASPLWVRLYKTREGLLTVATLSPTHEPTNATAKNLIHRLLEGLAVPKNATGGYESLDAISEVAP